MTIKNKQNIHYSQNNEETRKAMPVKRIPKELQKKPTPLPPSEKKD